MATKPKKAKKLDDTSTKRMRGESASSSSSDYSNGGKDRKVAMALLAPRATRASARACLEKNRDHSIMEEELKAQEEPKRRAIDFDFDKLRSDSIYIQPTLYKKMEPEEFTIEYYNKSGLSEVLIFDCDPKKLGMNMVDEKFTVKDVERLVGGDKMITVVEVASQGSVDMPLSRFIEYYHTPKSQKTVLYNVLSLEFSNSALTDYVLSPSLVRSIDWATSWPDERKMRTITFDKDGYFSVTHHYPRVENYCLMSPTECYTDFHIDFHGTSVWYHVKRGMKIFWIVEPTEQNLKMYEEYLKNTENSAFFGDIVEKCARIEVRPGNTLIIPSGWIHAVFTPEDSLVFGGNFLHSRQAMMQLNVLQGENRIGINKKYRYPYSEETVFFHLSKIVKSVTGRSYIRPVSRNQQDTYKEYVGEMFTQKKMHQRVPSEGDYADDGCVWNPRWDETNEYKESKQKLSEWDGKEEKKKDDANDDTINEAEEEMPVLSPKKTVAKVMDANIDEEIDDEMDERKESEMATAAKNVFGGHDDIFVDDYTFYHPISFNLDAGTGATAMHTLPLSMNEPAIEVDEAVLRREIHPLEVPQLEALIAHILKRPRVDLPIGLTRPNSLLQTTCHLLRERRRLAEMDGIPLPPSDLPDKEGSRKLHEEQKKAAAERKRKREEKKAKDEGEGEDSDWTPGDKETPRKKKAKKSGEGGGKIVLSASIREKEDGNEESPRRVEHKNKWNAAFYAWYAAQKELREQFRSMGKSARDHIRKLYFTPMAKEDKAFWMKVGEQRSMASSIRSSSVSIAPAQETATQPSPSQSVPPPNSHSHSLDMDVASTSSMSPPPCSFVPASTTRPAVDGDRTSLERMSLLSTHLDPSERLIHITGRDGLNSFQRFYESVQEKYDKEYPHQPKQMKQEMAWQREWMKMSQEEKAVFDNASGTAAPIEKQREVMRIEQRANAQQKQNLTQPSYHSGVVVTTANKPTLFHAMQLKFAAEGRLNAPSSSPIPFPTDRVKIADDVSLFIVDALLSKNPQYPELLDLINSFSFQDAKEKKQLEEKTSLLACVVNERYKKQLTIEDVLTHVKHLKKIVVEDVHTKGCRLPFLESVEKVARALYLNQPDKAAQRVGSIPVPDLISVKPIDKALLNAQSLKAPSSLVQTIATAAAIGMKTPQCSTTAEKEKLNGDENGDQEMQKESVFRDARAEPKPPDERVGIEGREISPQRNDRLATVIHTSLTRKKAERRGTPKGKTTMNAADTAEPVSSRSAPLKEDETDDEFLSNDEWTAGSVGSARKTQRENHWMAMKRAQELVAVKRFTENPQDWTAFDTYLRINYKSWCTSFNEEASNKLALKIKREYWNAEGQNRRWEMDAARFREEGRPRVYWRSDTVVEQEDRILEDKGLKVLPLGGEEKVDQGRPRIKSESSERKPEVKNEDEYLADDDSKLADEKDDEMIDVEGVEDEPCLTVATTESEEKKNEEGTSAVEEPPMKKSKGGRPKKDTPSEKKKRGVREEKEDFMYSGSTPRPKGKKAKPDPNKPLIVDGVPVNPLAEPAVANAYGYDPAKDIVPLGQGQLKSAYRRSKAQLDTPQMDAKRYKLEVKHDHLLDDDDHDDTHRGDTEGMGGLPRSTTPHGAPDTMEAMNVPIGDGGTRGASPSPGGNEFSPALSQRSSSFSRRPVQPVQHTPPLIPHAPSPLAARRISGTDGWGMMSGGRRRSDGERRERVSGDPSSLGKSSHYSPVDLPPATPSTSSTPSTPSTPSALNSSTKPTRLSQAEQFNMAAPKVIDAPRLATPLLPIQSSPASIHLTRADSMSGDESLTPDVFCAQLERITAELERANAILASSPNNGNV